MKIVFDLLQFLSVYFHSYFSTPFISLLNFTNILCIPKTALEPEISSFAYLVYFIKFGHKLYLRMWIDTGTLLLVNMNVILCVKRSAFFICTLLQKISGIDLNNVLWAAFTHAAPKSEKRRDCFLRFWDLWA